MPPLPLIRLLQPVFSASSAGQTVLSGCPVADTRLVNAVTAPASAFFTDVLNWLSSGRSAVYDRAARWLVSVLSCWLTLDCRPVMALPFAATPDLFYRR